MQQDISGGLYSILAGTTEESLAEIQTFRFMWRQKPLLISRWANDSKHRITFQTPEDIRVSGPWAGSQRQAKASIEASVKTILAFLKGKPDPVEKLIYLVGDENSNVLEAYRKAKQLPSKLVVATPANSFASEILSTPNPNRLSLHIPTWEACCFTPEDMVNCSTTPFANGQHWGVDLYKSFTMQVPFFVDKEELELSITNKLEESRILWRLSTNSLTKYW